MRATILILAACICMSASCEDRQQPACEDVICTMDFRMITLKVDDQGEDDTGLEVYTLRVSTGEQIKSGNTVYNDVYTVLDDGYRQHIAGKKEEFRFIGRKNGREVINEPYMITADCCHVSKISGREEIVIP